VLKRRITIQIKGSDEDDGYPRLSEFLKQLDAIKVALKHTERLHTGTTDAAVYFRIVSLSMASPATVVLEETPIGREQRRPRLPRVAISKQLVSTLSLIDRGRAIPERVRDLAALEAYRNVGSVLKKGGDAVTISSADKIVSIGQTFNKKIDRIIGPDQVIEGSITGRLLAINLHNTTRFEIYPSVGPTKVACDFDGDIKSRVIAGLDHNVRVIGRLRYKHWAPFPHAITADDIDVFPPDDELPTLSDLRGLLKSQESEDSGALDAE
jgi:hypothetical protein